MGQDHHTDLKPDSEDHHPNRCLKEKSKVMKGRKDHQLSQRKHLKNLMKFFDLIQMKAVGQDHKEKLTTVKNWCSVMKKTNLEDPETKNDIAIEIEVTKNMKTQSMT